MRIENLVRWTVIFEICALTDRQTGMLTAILRTPTTSELMTGSENTVLCPCAVVKALRFLFKSLYLSYCIL